MNVGSLFSGIGGFDLGLERAGMRTVWFCEQSEFCQRVLARHWPGVPCHPDVRSLVADADGYDQPQVSEGVNGEQGQRSAQRRRQLVAAGTGAGGRVVDGHGPEGDGGAVARRPASGDVGLPVSVPPVDVLCGGFPCQDLSYAGKGAGIDGARSGLWAEFARLIGELRPRYVVVENVPALLGRGAGRVLGDLAALGYDAEWDCLPASAFGAPHRRDRFWLVAYPAILRRERSRPPRARGDGFENVRDLLADPTQRTRLRGIPRAVQRSVPRGAEASRDSYPWTVEPDVGRVASRVPARVDRLRALGNALVPQIAEWLGRRILDYEEGRVAA